MERRVERIASLSGEIGAKLLVTNHDHQGYLLLDAKRSSPRSGRSD